MGLISYWLFVVVSIILAIPLWAMDKIFGEVSLSEKEEGD